MKVIVFSCERPTHKGCVGMEGNITKEYVFNGRKFFELTATNDGPYINGENGKKVKSWRIGNHADFLFQELKRLE